MRLRLSKSGCNPWRIEVHESSCYICDSLWFVKNSNMMNVSDKIDCCLQHSFFICCCKLVLRSVSFGEGKEPPDGCLNWIELWMIQSSYAAFRVHMLSQARLIILWRRETRQMPHPWYLGSFDTNSLFWYKCWSFRKKLFSTNKILWRKIENILEYIGIRLLPHVKAGWHMNHFNLYPK